MPRQLQTNNHGFTLLETILVLVMIAFFAVIAVSRQPSTDVTLKAQMAAFMGHIRYAQTRAMNTDTQWGIGIGERTDGENVYDHAYWLFERNADSERLVILPGEDRPVVDLNVKGITISSLVQEVPMNGLQFDTWGRPQSITADNAGNIIDTAWLSQPMSIVLSKSSGSGTSTESAAITPDTGFAQ